MAGGNGDRTEIIWGDYPRADDRDGWHPSYDAETGITNFELDADGNSVPRKSATPPERKLGERMPDGTIYAGISPNTHKPIYTTPEDAKYRTILGSQKNLKLTFEEAQKYGAKLDVHGQKDWRVPTHEELRVLFRNRAAIGGFTTTGSPDTAWYWSSCAGIFQEFYGPSLKRFSDGDTIFDCRKDAHASLRCVRG